MAVFNKIIGVFLVLIVLACSMFPINPVLAEEADSPVEQPKLLDKIRLFENRLAAGANLKATKEKGVVIAQPSLTGKTAEALVAPTVLLGSDGKMLTDYFGVANWANSPALTKFVDKLPGLGPANNNLLGQYIPVAVRDNTTYAGSDYYEIAVVEYEEQLHSELAPTRLRGYVQIVPAGWTGTDLLGNTYNAVPLTMANGLTQNITIRGAQAYGASKPHYLGPAIVATGSPKAGDPGTPVRIKFYNLLPTGVDGELFIPMDPTVMGAGMGPVMGQSYTQNRATVHLHGNNTVWISDGTPHQWITPANENTPYPKGVSVSSVPDMWFDASGNTVPAGTPGATNNPGDGAMTLFYSNAQSARLMFYHDHAMGITRLNVYAGEAAGYIITDVAEQDLINGTNNSGVNPGLSKVLPDIGIPLIIQDKSFVDNVTIGGTDPTWLDPLQTTFGTVAGTAHAGDLWYPHVYMPAQNPWDITGTNPFGRWMYGPWFYPPTTNIDFGPVANEYYQPDPLLPNYAPWEPPMRPSTPNPSMPGEAFMDTMLVNGTVYPYLDVDPKAYRFRVLNASNDRFVNLSLYQANSGIVGSLTTSAGDNYTADPLVNISNTPGDTTGTGFTLYATADVTPGSPTEGQVSFAIRTVGSKYTLPPVITITRAAGDTTGSGATATAVLYTNPTEVGMVPVSGTNWLPPFDASGVPDQSMAGPSWIQIGTEGGFLPAPVVIAPQPITWNTNPLTFNFGTVNGHSLLLGAAERADVIVDFSAYRGKTLILYNDAPAAFPAGSPTYDYYTNDQDLTAIGGASITPPGKGPNTRTIMQIRVADVAPTAYSRTALETVWAKGTGANAKRGVFELTQDPVIVPQAEYNSAYGKTGIGTDTFPTAAMDKYIQVNTYSKTIKPIDASGAIQAPVTLPIQLKGAHDEMGGVYDTGYGRMSGMLGLEVPATTSRIGQFLPYGYASPPVDVLAGSIAGTLIGTLDDGTQIWNIIHNGVDTHTIHVHLFNAQLVNRVGWDGIMLPPDANELGWKETFRMNPLEQIILAIRPILPTSAQIPFIDLVPNSVRLIDPTLPEGAILNAPPPAGWFDPNGVAIPSIANHYVNFGWEYVYHCHLLAHEEMDMMHGMAYAVPPKAPSNVTVAGMSDPLRVALNWTNNAVNATGYIVQRATDPSFTTNLVTISVGLIPSYIDTSILPNVSYYYRIAAINKVGDTTIPGFPVVTAQSQFSTAVIGQPGATGWLRVQTVPAVPSTIFIDGTPRDAWGLNWVELPAGSYTLSLSDLQGFATPTQVSVTQANVGPAVQPLANPITIVSGAITEVVANFTELGNIHVTTSPPMPATISVDGQPVNDWGFWTYLASGQYTVTFESIDGYITPSPVITTVAAGVTTNIVGTYTVGANVVVPSPHGFLRVQTSPAVPSTIFINGITRDTWGLNWVKLVPGAYTLDLTDVPGLKTPTTILVSQNGLPAVSQAITTPIMIVDSQITEVIVNFSPQGNLRVGTSPAVNATLFVNGQPMDNWGFWTYIDPGIYSVSFQTISGLQTPAPIVVTVSASATTHVVGDYSTGVTQVVIP